MYNVYMTVTYPIIIEKTDDGYYAECPFIDGVYTQGDTYENVVKNLEEVLGMTIADMKERGESVPSVYNKDSLSISSLTMSV